MQHSTIFFFFFFFGQITFTQPERCVLSHSNRTLPAEGCDSHAIYFALITDLSLSVDKMISEVAD